MYTQTAWVRWILERVVDVDQEQLERQATTTMENSSDQLCFCHLFAGMDISTHGYIPGEKQTAEI